ncbi:MAG TPA: MFS transporter [Acidimicrobiales bacterium]|nr:MFS transporter [Acidimicrobiales bacterium]
MPTRLLGRNRLPDAGSAYGRRWIMLVVICLGLMVLVVDTTIVNVALPTLGRQLHASTSGLQWIVDMYILVYAGLLLTAGSLGDRFGRYKAFTFGLTVFGLGSLGAALSGSVGSLIVTRATMGVGAAFVMPTTLSIITNVFTDPLERARAIGILGRGGRPRSGDRTVSRRLFAEPLLLGVGLLRESPDRGRRDRWRLLACP